MRLGIALRPSIFSPKELLNLVADLDKKELLTTVFIPDIAGKEEPIELSTASLTVSRRMLIGSGVLRITEHNIDQLARRILTVQSLSDGRFILGIGTGAVGKDPSARIEEMFRNLSELRDKLLLKSSRIPKIYVATLRKGIAKMSAGRCDGILMNFCSAEHAARVIKAFRSAQKGDADYACYIKIFFSHDAEKAKRNMIQEFLNYDSLPQYQKMFIENGVHEDILKAKDEITSGRVNIPASLYNISLYNPSSSSLLALINTFKKSGVTLPVIYPYFDDTDDWGFKQRTLVSLFDELAVIS